MGERRNGVMCQATSMEILSKNTKLFISVSVLLTISFLAGYCLGVKLNYIQSDSYFLIKERTGKPLEKYSIENLSKTDIRTGVFKETKEIENYNEFISKIFSYSFYPALDNVLKTTTGIINIPSGDPSLTYPLVILIRGYVDQKMYVSGMGSKNFGVYLAQNGFITIAPDFLGYASSDKEAENIFESRFQTYVTVISLIKHIEKNGIPGWDGKNIFIWGHSNGGQIALTILEIMGEDYPTALWAPVSKPFPYSVLYYTDESEDRGKLIRTELFKFEMLYNVEKYSLTNYFDRISAPIQLHQGTMDNAVPAAWSDSLYSAMIALDKDIDYIKHPGADHNMAPNWGNAVEQSINFFADFIQY